MTPLVVPSRGRARTRTNGRRNARSEPAEASAAGRRNHAPVCRCDSPSRACPELRRGDRARSPQTGAADGLDAAATAPPRASGARAFPVRGATPVPVPGGGHHPRSLVRARPGRDGPRRPARLSYRRAASRAPRGSCFRRVGTHSPRPRSSSTRSPDGKIVVTPNAVDPAFTPGGRYRRLSPLCRRNPGAKEPPCGRRRGPRSRAPTRRCGPGEGTGARARARAPRGRPARLRGQGAARRPVPRGRVPRAAVTLRGLRPSRCSRRWRAGRPSSPTNDAAMREVGGDAAVYAKAGAFRTRSAPCSPSGPEMRSRAGARTCPALLLGRDRPANEFVGGRKRGARPVTRVAGVVVSHGRCR